MLRAMGSCFAAAAESECGFDGVFLLGTNLAGNGVPFGYELT